MLCYPLSRVGVMVQTSAHTLAPPTFAPVGSAPSGIALGDFTGDGVADAAVVEQTYDLVSILRGDGIGHVGDISGLLSVGGQPAAVALGRVDAGLFPDLVIALQGESALATALGTAGLSFGPLAKVSVGGQPLALALGDLNGDGAPDVASANLDGTCSVVLNVAVLSPNAGTAR